MLHIIVRNRFVDMCDLLLNDAKYINLLHQQNKIGETPCSIDGKNKHEMLTQFYIEGTLNFYCILITIMYLLCDMKA